MKKKSHFKSKYIMYLLILILIMSFAIPLTSWYMAAISAVISFISTILIVALWEGVCGKLAELESENKELERENKDLQDLCNKTYDDLTKEIDRLQKEAQ